MEMTREWYHKLSNGAPQRKLNSLELDNNRLLGLIEGKKEKIKKNEELYDRFLNPRHKRMIIKLKDEIQEIEEIRYLNDNMIKEVKGELNRRGA